MPICQTFGEERLAELESVSGFELLLQAPERFSAGVKPSPAAKDLGDSSTEEAKQILREQRTAAGLDD